MSAPVGYDNYLNFINCQLSPPGRAVDRKTNVAVTISRQSGCGAHVVAEKLAQYLQSHSSKDAPPWTVFDHNLMEKVLADHHLPEKIARLMPEDRASNLDDIMYELFDVRPDSQTLVGQTAETILRLAELGNVILLGRGGNVITAKLPGVVHVRLIAPLEKRVEHMQQYEELTRKAALERIQREDLGRSRYLKKYFARDIEDPLLYHLVINTDLVSLDSAARLIGDTVLNAWAK